MQNTMVLEMNQDQNQDETVQESCPLHPAGAPIATHIKCLQGFIMGCVWVILRVTKWDMKRNTELRAMAGLERVEVMLMRRRLRW